MGPVPVQPFASVAVTVIGNEPVAEVVPERTPLTVLSEMPAGSAPVSLQAIVPLPPVCEKVWLNATPAVPVDTPGLVTLMTLQAMTRV